MKRSIEDYWRELRSQELTHGFPFSRDTFRKILTDVTENEYPVAEAIVKHTSPGSGIEPPEFLRLMTEQYHRQPYREDAKAFSDGYWRLTGLVQLGFTLAVEGPEGTEAIMRQISYEPGYERFLRDNMYFAAAQIMEDPSGRTAMIRCANKMIETSGTYFADGVQVARDTFIAYSKAYEGFYNGALY